jgi:RNA polymerase sigma factor (sigma-70 family)
MITVSSSTLRLQHWHDRIQAGDEAAGNELIDHYYQRFLAMVRTIVGRHDRLRTKEETAELLHEAFAQRLKDVLHRLPRPTSRQDFMDAVHTELRWAIQDRARHYFKTKRRLVVQQDRPEGSASGLLDAQPGRELEPSAPAIWHELLALVGQILTANDRRVFDRRHIDGMTWDEIAEEQGIAKETARKRYFRATAKLRNELKQRGYEWPASEA